MAEPVRVIFDTDMGNDIDDAIAHAVLHALETAPEFVVIDDITLSEEDVEGGLLQMTLQLSTYFQAAE